jgi:putative oxidoreductase
MQTFNIFPELFTFSLIAPFILRIVLGYIFINLGLLKLTKEKSGWIGSLHTLGIKPAGFFVGLIGIVEIIGGLLLLVGAYTQLVALVFAIIAISETLIEYKENSILRRDLAFYLLLSAICISLLLTGAGAYAVDIPLL